MRIDKKNVITSEIKGLKMSQELIEGLIEVKSDIKNILFMQAQTHGTVAAMQQKQDEYQAKSADDRQAMAVDIGIIKGSMADFSAYQRTCESDRKITDKRVGKIENFQSNQKKVAGGIAALVTFLAYGGSKLVENSGKVFEKIGSFFA